MYFLAPYIVCDHQDGRLYLMETYIACTFTYPIFNVIPITSLNAVTTYRIPKINLRAGSLVSPSA